MAKNFGVTFTIGASLGASVNQAFASVQSKLKATQQAMRAASQQKSGLENVLKVRARRDAIALQIRKEGASPALLHELKQLSGEYDNAAKKAGVYGASLELITRRQYELEQAMTRGQRRMQALQTIQRGRDMREEQSRVRKTAISNAFADLAPVASLALPIKTGMEFDSAMSQVRAVTGATGEDFDKLRAQARELGATTVWSAREAALGMNFLAMAGFNTNDVMAAMPGMLSLASAGNMDLASTADIASNILTGFNFSADQMSHVGDMLARTFTNSNTSIASLGEAFKFCAPVAANAGQAFESVAAMIGKLGDAGIQGSMAGTGLNAIIARMAKPPREAELALKKLGVSVADASGKMRPLEDVFADVEKKMSSFSEQERIALAKALYGAEHFAKGMVLQTASVNGSLVKLRDSLKDVDGYADAVAKTQTDNLAGDFKQLNSAMQEVAICITDVVTPPLRQFMGHVTPMVQSLGQWISANPRLVQGLLALGGAFAALKVAGLAFTLLNSYRRSFVGGLISMRGQAMLPLAAVRNGFSALRMELTRPVGIQTEQAKAGLASLASRMDALRQKTGQLAASLRGISASSLMAGSRAAASGAMAATGRVGWNTLRLGIGGVGMAFKTMFGPMSLLLTGMSLGADYIIRNWDKIAPYFQALWAKVKDIFNAAMAWLKPIYEKITAFIAPIIDGIKTVAGAVGKGLSSVGDMATRAFDWVMGNDKEKEHKEKLQKEARPQAQTPGAQPARPKQPAVMPPAAAKVATPAQASVPTVMQAQAPGQADMDDLDDAEARMGRVSRRAPQKRAPAQAAPAQAAPAQAASPQNQIVQPQIQVALNITQNGIPEQSFASGVMSAIKSRQGELEQIISAIVNEQARLAYG